MRPGILGPRALGTLPWKGLLVALLLVALDQWLKHTVFAWWDPLRPDVERDPHGHLRLPLVGTWLGVMTACNPGAAFSRFGEHPSILVLGRLIAALLLIRLLARADPRRRLSFLAITLVLAGAVGNLCDNLGTGCHEAGHPIGLVRDFIDVWFRSDAWGWDWHFPTFNLADSFLSVGAVAWLVSGLLRSPGGRAEEDAAGHVIPPAPRA